MSSSPVEGHCLCGAIRFVYDGEPVGVLHCHCESCRRATSSPMTTWVLVPRSAFRFTQGVPRLYPSSPDVTRGFCPDCGAQLTYENARIPDEVHLYAASLDDPLRVTPTRHVYVEERLAWFDTADELPRYARTSRGGAQPISAGNG
jgi:hypothetical protein